MCGRRRHGYGQGGGVRRWRHQDFGCWRVGLVASMPRVDCPECGVVVARVPWAEPGSRFTRDFEAECAWLMGVANRKTVSGFLHVAWRAAGDIARRVADRLRTAMPSPFDGLTAIGVDGTSHRKGHTYITVVVGHERHRVVWAHDGYGGDVFDLFFRRLAEERKASIRVVAGDGARWIDSCVAAHCPNAERVLDGFHIVSWMTGALDQVRRRLWHQARRAGNEEVTKRMRGVKHAVLKKPDDPTDRQNDALGAIRNTDPKGRLYRAWQLKELLRTLLRHPPRPGARRTRPLGVPGLAQPHTRDRRTLRKDPTPTPRHPQDHPAGLPQRQTRSIRQPDQGRHPHGLRLPPRRQPHRPDHAPMRRTRHAPTTTRNLTHENSRSLRYYEYTLYRASVTVMPDAWRSTEFHVGAKDCRWMTLDEMLADPGINKINHDVVAMVRDNL